MVRWDAEMEMGQWVTGQLPVTYDPLTHDDKIAVQ